MRYIRLLPRRGIGRKLRESLRKSVAGRSIVLNLDHTTFRFNPDFIVSIVLTVFGKLVTYLTIASSAKTWCVP